MLYPHLLLVRGQSGLRIYKLEFKADAVESACKEPTLLASNCAEFRFGSITDCLSLYHDGWLATAYFQQRSVRSTEGIRFVSSSGHTANIDVPLDGPYFTGASHTICRVINFGAGGPVGFQCFANLIRHHRHPGYMRLGHTEAPSPKHCTYIPLAGRQGFVREVTFDEETGRVCTAFRPSNKNGTGPPEILVADII